MGREQEVLLPTSQIPDCDDQAMNVLGALWSDFQTHEEGSLGLLCGHDQMYEGFPPDNVKLPAVSYAMTQTGHRGMLTLIVWGEGPRAIHARIRKVLTQANQRGVTVRYITSGPVLYDERLRTICQRASYLVKVQKKA